MPPYAIRAAILILRIILRRFRLPSGAGAAITLKLISYATRRAMPIFHAEPRWLPPAAIFAEFRCFFAELFSDDSPAPGYATFFPPCRYYFTPPYYRAASAARHAVDAACQDAGEDATVFFFHASHAARCLRCSMSLILRHA